MYDQIGAFFETFHLCSSVRSYLGSTYLLPFGLHKCRAAAQQTKSAVASALSSIRSSNSFHDVTNTTWLVTSSIYSNFETRYLVTLSFSSLVLARSPYSRSGPYPLCRDQGQEQSSTRLRSCFYFLVLDNCRFRVAGIVTMRCRQNRWKCFYSKMHRTKLGSLLHKNPSAVS